MKYKLIIFDIDGTITRHISSWRYIHEKLGLWDNIANRYQDLFLAGKISYRKFCELDAAHWRGISEKKVREAFRSVKYARNARKCLKLLRSMGFKLAAVSTGLQYMAEKVKKDMEFDFVLSNRLLSRRGKLTGKVSILIPHGGKGAVVKELRTKFKVSAREIICVGDSSGDLPMARASGYSIAFNSSSPELSEFVDYECSTGDFMELFRKISCIACIDGG